jgi:hypothetical protein
MQGISLVRMSPKELKMQPIIRLHSNPRYGRGVFKFALEMYCGLHFQYRRAHYHS